MKFFYRNSGTRKPREKIRETGKRLETLQLCKKNLILVENESCYELLKPSTRSSKKKNAHRKKGNPWGLSNRISIQTQ